MLDVNERTDAKSEESRNATPQSGSRIKNQMKILNNKKFCKKQ
jgi:hypothetical protein